MDTHIWKKIGNRLSYLQSRNRDTDAENKHIDTKSKREVGMNWETETDIHTPSILCIKQITKENLSYSAGDSTQCSVEI